jgi:omega-amidase
MKTHHVFGVQTDPAWENPAGSCAQAESLLVGTRFVPGSLVVLPEMFTTGFTMNTTKAEAPGGVGEQWLASTAQRHQCWVVGGLARRTPEGVPANEALVFGPDGERVATYRKQRPFTAGGEPQHYAAGDQCCVFAIGDLSVALFICYDLRFPELFRVAARQRPHLYVVIASWPETRIAHWEKLLQARAIENQAYVLGVNRVGVDPTHKHNGHSLLINPWGEPLASAGESAAVFGGVIDLEGLMSYREKLPFLSDLK